METPAEREQRVKRLERERSQRHSDAVWPTPDDAGVGTIPIEVGPGRGDLNLASGWYPSFPTALQLVGHRAVSFSRLFMGQPWVAAAVMRMMTWAIRVPLKAYRRTGDDTRVRLRADEHLLAAMIDNPWLGGSQCDLIMSLLGPLLVHGNSVTEVDLPNGNLDSLRLISKDWRYTRPIMPFRDTIDGFTFDYDSPELKHEVSADQVLHLKWWSPTGPIGVSPLQQLGVSLQIEDAAQRFQRGFFVNGARPTNAVVASEQFLGLDRAERELILAQLRKDVTELYTGPENAGRPVLLPPGLDWKATGQTTVEAALIDQRKITREEIAGVYLIPPPLLGILDRATYANIQTQREMTYTDCLGPPLVLLEQSINAQVVRDLLQEEDVYCEFDFGGVLRGDRLQEIEALREGIASALVTPNEGRTVLNLPRSGEPAMDEFYLPANNLQPVANATQPTEPAAPTQNDANPPSPVPDMPGQPGERGQKLHVVAGGREYVLQPER